MQNSRLCVPEIATLRVLGGLAKTAGFKQQLTMLPCSEAKPKQLSARLVMRMTVEDIEANGFHGQSAFKVTDAEAQAFIEKRTKQKKII